MLLQASEETASIVHPEKILVNIMLMMGYQQ